MYRHTLFALAFWVCGGMVGASRGGLLARLLGSLDTLSTGLEKEGKKGMTTNDPKNKGKKRKVLVSRERRSRKALTA